MATFPMPDSSPPFAIRRAARRGDLTALTALLTAGIHPDIPHAPDGPDEPSALTLAAESPRASIEVLQALLESGADPNLWGDSIHGLPLNSAARSHQIDKIQLLIDHGADPSGIDPFGYGAILNACFGRRQTMVPTVAHLLKAGASPDPQSSYGESALSISSRQGRFDVVRLLLDHRANPTPLCWTPLHHAAAFGTLRTEETLIELCEHMTATDGMDRTPLHVAVAANDVIALQLLLDAGSDPRDTWHGERGSLELAAMTNAVDAMKLLLHCGLDPDETWSDQTALMVAILSNSIAAAKTLLDAGADPNATTSTADQPIHFAQSQEAFELLLAAGANINAISGEGRWPLKNAARSGNPKLTAFLIDRGAEPDLTSTGETALFDAVTSDSIETARVLLDAGADPNAIDFDGCTPAFWLQSPEMAEFLATQGEALN